MKSLFLRWGLLFLVLGAVGAGLTYWLTDWHASQDQSATWPLTIANDSGVHRFSVELAVTESEHTKGLMFREDLADDAGMLFIYNQPRIRTMWMRNTPLSLDILFIDPDGIIRRITRDTVPFSSTTIISPRDTQYVLELRAGVTQKLGIRASDQVRNLPAPDQASSSS